MEWPQAGMDGAVGRVLEAVVADVARGSLAGSPDFYARPNWQYGELSRRHRLIGGTGLDIQERTLRKAGRAASHRLAPRSTAMGRSGAPDCRSSAGALRPTPRARPRALRPSGAPPHLACRS